MASIAPNLCVFWVEGGSLSNQKDSRRSNESREKRGEINIGMPSRAFPVTPPCVRVRTRRFGWLYGWPSRQRRETERAPVGIGQGIVQSGAFAKPPGAVATAGG